jgi:hypothetical protein
MVSSEIVQDQDLENEPGQTAAPRLPAQSPGGLAGRIIANSAEFRAACRQGAGEARSGGLAYRQPSRTDSPRVAMVLLCRTNSTSCGIGCAGSLMLATWGEAALGPAGVTSRLRPRARRGGTDQSCAATRHARAAPPGRRKGGRVRFIRILGTRDFGGARFPTLLAAVRAEIHCASKFCWDR